MFNGFKARAEARRARARHEMSRLEGLMAENRRRMTELREASRCPYGPPDLGVMIVADPTALCAVTNCGQRWTTDTHGWRLCLDCLTDLTA